MTLTKKTAQPSLPTARAWLLLASVAITMFGIVFNSLAVMTGLSTIRSHLHFSAQFSTWIVVAFSICACATMMTLSQICDRFGATRVYISGQILFFIAGIIAALSHAGWVLLIAQVIQGISVACLLPASLSLLKTGTPAQLQKLFLVIWVASQVTGGSVGPLIGGLFSQYATWRLIYWFNLIFSTLAIVFSLFFLKHITTDKKKIKIDWPGSCLLIIFSTVVVLMMNQGNAWGWLSPILIIFYAVTPITLILFIISQKYASDPIMSLNIYTNKPFVIGSLLYFTMGVLIYGINYFFNLYAQNKGGLNISPTLSGLLLIIFNGPAAILGLLDSWLLEIFGFALLLISGSVLLCASFCLFWFLPNNTITWVWWKLLIAGIGMGIAYSVCTALALSHVKQYLVNEASGIINYMNYLGETIGISATYIIFSNSISAHLKKLSPTLRKQLHSLLKQTQTTQIKHATQAFTNHAHQLLNQIIDHAYHAANLCLSVFAFTTLGLSILASIFGVKHYKTTKTTYHNIKLKIAHKLNYKK